MNTFPLFFYSMVFVWLTGMVGWAVTPQSSGDGLVYGFSIGVAALVMAMLALIMVGTVDHRRSKRRLDTEIELAATAYDHTHSLEDWLRCRGYRTSRRNGVVYMLKGPRAGKRLGGWNAVPEESFAAIEVVHRELNDEQVLDLLARNHDWKARRPGRSECGLAA